MYKLIPALFTIFLLTGCVNSDDLSTTALPTNNQDNQYQQLADQTKQANNQANEQPMGNNAQILSPANQPNLLDDYSKATLRTNMGDIKIEFFNDDSPITVNNFLYLAKQGFYDGTIFHRVIKNFMIQGGDPLSKQADKAIHGTGGPDYRFADEFNDHKLVWGSLAMANSGPNTNGSQFFIVTTESAPWLDGRHTNFGRLIDGLEVVKRIENMAVDSRDHPLTDIIIESIDLE